jgi:hypothetical protein
MDGGDLAGILAVGAPFITAVLIVGFVQAGKTVRYYLDWRMKMAERQTVGSPSVLGAIQELRAEIAALRKHEADAVLSFDTTLQTMEARLKHLEGRALGEGTAERLSPAVAAPTREDTTRLVARSG